jgi:hypothetical protein
MWRSRTITDIAVSLQAFFGKCLFFSANMMLNHFHMTRETDGSLINSFHHKKLPMFITLWGSFLFGHVKQALSGRNSEEWEYISQAVNEILHSLFSHCQSAEVRTSSSWKMKSVLSIAALEGSIAIGTISSRGSHANDSKLWCVIGSTPPQVSMLSEKAPFQSRPES